MRGQETRNASSDAVIRTHGTQHLAPYERGNARSISGHGFTAGFLSFGGFAGRPDGTSILL